MKLAEYVKTQNFTQGFPEGDTYIETAKIDVEDFTFNDEHGKALTRTKLKADGKEFYCPRSVLRKINELTEKGEAKVRVTRTGTTKDNTTYTVVGIK
jgi:hypothetical protein